jgi:hypothetical protein
MSQQGRAQLSVQGFGPDALWYQSPQNMFEYRPYFCSKVYIPEDFDITPTDSQSSKAMSNTTECTWKFEIDKRADLLGGIELIQPRTAVTVATTPAFDDFEGYATIQQIEFKYNNKTFHRIWGETMYNQLQQEATPQERDAEAAAQFGYKTDIQRQNNAQSPYCWTARLRVPWEAQHAKIPMCAMPNKITVEVTYNSPAKCCKVASGSCTVTYNQPTLRTHWYHVPQADRKMYYDMVNDPQGQGVAIKITDYEFHRRESIANSSGRQRVKLANIKNSITKLNIMLRTQSDLDTQTTLDLWDYQTCSRMWIEEAGTRITDVIRWADSTNGTTAPNYMLYNVNNKLHPDGVTGFNVGIIPFVHPRSAMANKYDCMGSRYFNKYTNPELVIENDSAPGATQYLDVYAERHQLLLYAIGEIRVALY